MSGRQLDVVEAFTRSKDDSRPNEDTLVVGDHHAAVIDGVTDKSGLAWQHCGETVTSGRFAALVVAEALALLDAAGGEPDAMTALSFVSAHLDTAIRRQRPWVPRRHWPACALVVYSARRHEVWRVGDCSWRFGDVVHEGRLRFDEVTSRLRRTVLEAHLADGRPVEELAAAEPGRAAIQGLLEAQGLFTNRDHELGYGAVNGTDVPAGFLEIDPLDGNGTLVLASDGYPDISGDRAAGDARLAELLRTDPLCIGPLLGTKAAAPGATSYDDRTWLALRV